MNRQDLVELIRVYEKIIHGGDGKYGLFDCYDPYYAGCWDDDLIKVAELKTKMGILEVKNDCINF